MVIFGVVVLAVVGFGNGNVSADGTPAPQSQSTVKYPIRFDNVPAVKVPEPHPTVSSPIRWER